MTAPCARCTGDSFPAWRGTFCGLAGCLGREFGNSSRLLVNRDAAFIGLIGVSLDPSPLRWKQKTCCNPLAKPFPVMDDHPAILHAAAVSVCGLAAKLEDDIHDEGFLRRNIAQVGRFITGSAVDRAVATLNRTSFPTAEVMETLKSQAIIETRMPENADGPTAKAFGMITSHLADLLEIPAQRPALHGAGAALGSLVYWRDAWQDRREDARRGRFNAFEKLDHKFIQCRITAAWHQFASTLNDLPFQQYADLIANIQSATEQARSSFLQLREEPKPNKRAERKRKRQEDARPDSCWDACDCCDCCNPCDCRGISIPKRNGCCDKACDCGPGDSGCCDCNPCDGCDCCPCN